jgi:hypothetical protein
MAQEQAKLVLHFDQENDGDIHLSELHGFTTQTMHRILVLCLGIL